MRRPSAPLVLSSLALLIALSGTAVAASGLVTSRDIKDRTIQIRDLSPAAIKALRGSFDAAKLTGTSGAQIEAPPGTLVGAEAFCPSNSVAISGGFRVLGGSVRAVGELTQPTGSRSGHTVLLYNDGPNTGYGYAFALCAAP